MVSKICSNFVLTKETKKKTTYRKFLGDRETGSRYPIIRVNRVHINEGVPKYEIGDNY